MSELHIAKPDGITLVATYGTAFFVAVNLICRVSKGYWGSVAFMAIIAIMGLAFYIRLLPLDDLNGDGSEQ